MIKLRQMTSAEFDSYLEPAIQNYAEENVNAGHWTVEIAEERARAVFEALLPNGADSDGNYLLSIMKDGELVGSLWFAQTQTTAHTAFIYDFVITPAARGKGIGKAALREFERHVEGLGFAKIGLQVFAHNEAARGLYESSGYETTAFIMGKGIGAGR